MKAAAIDRFGGPDVLRVRSLTVPTPKADEVLIELDVAGIGVWDPLVREGKLELGPHTFPFVIGNDGAGTVAEIGRDVKRFQVGDRVYLVGSREAALALTPWFVPVDAAIVGIVDEVYTPERAPAAPAPVDDDPTEAMDTRPKKRPQAQVAKDRKR